MVSFTKNDNGYAVEFTSNPLYLKNGKMNFPVNALSMVIDKSNTATFKRTSTNDVAFSAKISDIQFDGTQATKANIETLFAETCTGAIGGDEEMIPVSVTLTGTTMAFYNEDNELLFSADTSAYLADKYVKQAYTSGTTLYLVIDTETGDTTVQVDLNAVLMDYYTKEEIDNAEMAIVSAITQCDSRLDFLEDEVEDFAYESDLETLEAEFIAFSGQVENAEEATAAALNDLDERKLDASAYTSSDLSNYYNKTQVDTKLADKLDVSAYTQITVDTALNTGSTNPVANSAVTIGMNSKADIVRLTQQQYDALSPNYDPYTIYIITDASPVAIDTALNSGSTNPVANSAITVALDDKLDSSAYTQITIDSALNTGSTNPVANSAITVALADKLDASAYVIDSALNTGSTNPVQNAVITTNINSINATIGDINTALNNINGNS